MQLKVCPKCRGQVFIEDGVEVKSEYCLQCGYRKEIDQKVPVLAGTKGKAKYE